MTSSLKSQALHGAFWSFIERFGLLGVQFIISVILARILSPAEFGLVAMITIFTLLAQTVVVSGFGQALIQKKDCTPEDESTAFWFNLLAGAFMTSILFLTAPWIARFYQQPQLTAITRLASLSLLINSFSVVQNALMQKELLFKQRTIASIAGITISGITSIIMALQGFGVWALVLQVLLNNLIRTCMLWVVHPWRPLFCFSKTSFEALFRFGSNMLLSGLLNTIYDNIYLLLIGRLYSATDLGFYQRAKEFIVASSHSLTLVLSQVNFPLLSKLQNDPIQLRKTFSKVLRNGLFIIIPIMVGLGICAPNIIRVLLGEKWMPSVPYLQLLCVVGGLFPVHLLNLNVLMALGRSDLFFRLEVIKKILVTGGIFIAYRYGIMALLAAQVASSALALLINSYYTKKLAGYGLFRQLSDNRKMLLSSLVMGLLVYGLGNWIDGKSILKLFIQIPAGAAAFLVSSRILNDPTLSDWTELLTGKLKTKKLGL